MKKLLLLMVSLTIMTTCLLSASFVAQPIKEIHFITTIIAKIQNKLGEYEKDILSMLKLDENVVETYENTIQWKVADKYIIDIKPIANNVIHLYRKLSDEDIEFLFIVVPSGNSVYDERLGSELDLLNHNVGLVLETLKKANVPFVDLRYTKEWTSSQYDDIFLKDEHWNPSIALEATKYIAETSNSLFDFSFDTELYDKSNFYNYVENITIEDSSNDSSFKLPAPKFNTEFEVRIPDANIINKGNFAEVFINEERLQLEESGDIAPYQKAFYITNTAETYIRNNNPLNNEDLKIVSIQNSFGWPISNFLSIQASEVHTIWPYGFDDNILDHILEKEADLVTLQCIADTFNEYPTDRNDYFYFE